MILLCIRSCVHLLAFFSVAIVGTVLSGCGGLAHDVVTPPPAGGGLTLTSTPVNAKITYPAGATAAAIETLAVWCSGGTRTPQCNRECLGTDL